MNRMIGCAPDPYALENLADFKPAAVLQLQPEIAILEDPPPDGAEDDGPNALDGEGEAEALCESLGFASVAQLIPGSLSGAEELPADELVVEALHARAGDVLRLVKTMRRRLDAGHAKEQKDHEHVSRYWERHRQPDEARLKWAEYELANVATALRPYFKKKQRTWHTPWGDVSFTSYKGGTEFTDRKAFDAFVKANYPELTTEEVVVKVAASVVAEVMKRLEGELPPGVDTYAAGETFKYTLPE